MLNKEVCKKCVEAVREWNKSDDDRWLFGQVTCPQYQQGLILTGKVPNKCSYKLEHTVMSDAK